MPWCKTHSYGSPNAAMCWQDSPRWVIDNFLHNLFVDPQWQGKGVGSLLLEQVQRSFKRSGTLKCLSRNENALRFYQHHGWKLEAQGASPDGDYWLMRYTQP